MNKKVKTSQLFSCETPYLKDLFEKYEYPWEMLGQIKNLCKELLEKGIEGFTEIEPGILVGRDVSIAKTATIILSGATGDMTAGQALECDQMYASAVEKYGMPAELFLKENKATNAYLNMVYAKDLILKQGGFEQYQNILCVGNSFLLRRASMYASKLEFPMERMQFFGVYDKEGRNISPDGWWKSEVSIQRVMAEIERIGKYYATGNMSIF